jgi:hypothetical protein
LGCFDEQQLVVAELFHDDSARQRRPPKLLQNIPASGFESGPPSYELFTVIVRVLNPKKKYAVKQSLSVRPEAIFGNADGIGTT